MLETHKGRLYAPFHILATSTKLNSMKDPEVIKAIIAGITAIAGLIFIKKRKTKITKRKQKTVDTTDSKPNQLTKIN